MSSIKELAKTIFPFHFQAIKSAKYFDFVTFHSYLRGHESIVPIDRYSVSLLGSDLVAQTTQIRDIHCDQIEPFYLSDNVLADIVDQAEQYQFYFYDGVEDHIKTSNNYSVLLYLVDGLEYGVTYDAFVRIKVNGVWGPFGDTCQIEMADAIPPTQLRPEFCSTQTEYFLEANMLADFVYGADSYEFAFNDGTNEYIYPSNNYSFFLYEADDILTDVTYEVYVRSIIGSMTSEWGDTCLVTISDEIPLVNIRDQYCQEDTLYALGNTILADFTAGYTGYYWFFYDLDSEEVHEYTSDNYSINLDEVPGVAMGRTYQVRVAAIIENATGELGAPCIVSTSSTIPSSTLLAEYCDNDTVLTLNDVLVADTVSSLVDQYLFFFDNGISIIEFMSSSNELLLSDVPGLQVETEYTVIVEVVVDGNYSLDGPSCSIYIGEEVDVVEPSILVDGLCSSDTVLYLNDQLVAEEAALVDEYLFIFMDGAISVIYASSDPSIDLVDVPGLEYGMDYDVRVEVVFEGDTTDTGAVCTISMAAGPLTTELIGLSCDSVYHFPSAEELVCFPVFAATLYEFRFTQDIGIPISALSTDEIIALDEVAGLQEGFYDVDVRGFAGEVWGDWGDICSIELNDSTVNSLNELDLPDLAIYPNPSSDALVNISGYEGLGDRAILELIDINGRTLEVLTLDHSGEYRFGSSLNESIYILRLAGENGRVHVRWAYLH